MWNLVYRLHKRILQKGNSTPSLGRQDPHSSSKTMRIIRHNLERVLCLPITEQDPTALVEKISMKAPQVSGGAAASCMVESWRLPRSVTTLSFVDGYMGRGYITVRVGSLPEHKRSKLNRELNSHVWSETTFVNYLSFLAEDWLNSDSYAAGSFLLSKVLYVYT